MGKPRKKQLVTRRNYHSTNSLHSIQDFYDLVDTLKKYPADARIYIESFSYDLEGIEVSWKEEETDEEFEARVETWQEEQRQKREIRKQKKDKEYAEYLRLKKKFKED